MSTIVAPELPVLQPHEHGANNSAVPAINRALELSKTLKPLKPAKSSGLIRRISRGAQIAQRLATFPAGVMRARRGAVQLPRIVTHTVTFGCNARCIMCDSWKLPTAGDLSLEEIAAVYSQLPSVDAVRLTGGEPFIRTDMPEIVALANHYLKPLLIYISSNGFLTERIVSFCENRDLSVPLELAISIDGIEPHHNRIRGSSLAWRSAWKTIDALAPRRRELNLTLAVNQTVVDDGGLQQYEELHAYLEPLNIEHHLVIAYDESATYSLVRDRKIEWEPDAFSSFANLDETLLETTLQKAEEHASRLPWHRRVARNYYLRGLRERALEGKAKANPTCQALHTHLRIFPNGDVPVCQFNSQSVGNFREQYFAEIWSSVLAANQRKWVRACAGCWAECEVAPNALYTLDVLRKP